MRLGDELEETHVKHNTRPIKCDKVSLTNTNRRKAKNISNHSGSRALLNTTADEHKLSKSYPSPPPLFPAIYCSLKAKLNSIFLQIYFFLLQRSICCSVFQISRTLRIKPSSFLREWKILGSLRPTFHYNDYWSHYYATPLNPYD